MIASDHITSRKGGAVATVTPRSDRATTISTLAAGLGHDMKNVILPVRAHLNALFAAEASLAEMPAPERRLHLEQIRRGVSYLHQLADGLHFLSLGPDQVEQAPASTNLKIWWSEVEPLISRTVPMHIAVAGSFSPRLPNVAIAAHWLTQAVLNLVVNAGESIAKSGKRRGSVRVWARAARGGGHVRLGVTDDGCGMRKEVKRRAFEAFFTTKPRHLGTGLGLAIVRGVAERISSSIEVESRLGKGTTIVMNLPVAVKRAHVRKARSAFIAVRDGRTGSTISGLLQETGVPIVRDAGDILKASILVVESSTAGLAAARRWRRRRPNGSLILIGRPARGLAQKWNTLDPVVIHDPDDLFDIRSAIIQAL